MSVTKEQYEEVLRSRKDVVFARATENASGKWHSSDAGILSNEKLSLISAVSEVASELGYEFSALISVPLAEIHQQLTDEWIKEFRSVFSQLSREERALFFAKAVDQEVE